MTWFLIVVLAVVAVLAVLTIFVLARIVTDSIDDERVRIEAEVRSAERRLHDIARNAFAAMLAEARAHGHGRLR